MTHLAAEAALFAATILAAAIFGWRFPWLLEVSWGQPGAPEGRAALPAAPERAAPPPLA